MTPGGSGDPSGQRNGFSCCGCLAMVFASIVLVVGGLFYTFFEVLFFGCLSSDIWIASGCLLDGVGGMFTVALVVIAVSVAAVALLALAMFVFGTGD